MTEKTRFEQDLEMLEDLPEHNQIDIRALFHAAVNAVWSALHPQPQPAPPPSPESHSPGSPRTGS